MKAQRERARLEFDNITMLTSDPESEKPTAAPDYNKLFIRRLLELDRSKTP